MKKLCVNDEYLTEFKTDIVKKEIYDDNTCGIVLKETYFYPESGGQTADHGFIGDAKVLDVKIKDDEIIHITDRATEESNVKCKIDWDRRFDHMQQHTGQHILSGVIEENFGIKTLSFHMGETDSSIETDMKTITNERIAEIEKLVNDVIVKDIKINKYFTDKDVEGVRKKIEINGPKRVVEIEGVDISYCGGTHVNRTGEIGIFKITGTDKVRKNIRLHFKCGYRAMYDYQKRFLIVDKLKNILTRDEETVVEGVKALIEREKELKKQVKTYRLKELDNFMEKIQENVYTEKTDEFSDEEIRYIQSKLIETGTESLILNKNTKRLFIAVSEDKNDLFKSIIDKLRKEFGVKGGGNRGKFQLMLGEDDDEICTRMISLLKN